MFTKKQLLLLEIASLILIVFLFFVFFGLPEPIPKQEENPAPIEKTFNITYWYFLEGYTTPVFTVKNATNISWQLCSMTVNEEYKADIQDILTEEQVVSAANFAKDNGLKFDTTSSVNIVCVICRKPEYKKYCGTFE